MVVNVRLSALYTPVSHKSAYSIGAALVWSRLGSELLGLSDPIDVVTGGSRSDTFYRDA